MKENMHVAKESETFFLQIFTIDHSGSIISNSARISCTGIVN